MFKCICNYKYDWLRLNGVNIFVCCLCMYPCRNCPFCYQVPIRARSDFPHVAAGGHMVWPGLETHRIMIEKIIFKFSVVGLIL